MTATQQPQATSSRAKAAAARARSTAAKKSSSNNDNNTKQQNGSNKKNDKPKKNYGGKNNTTTHKASTKVPAVPIALDGKQKRANRKSYRRAKQLEVRCAYDMCVAIIFCVYDCTIYYYIIKKVIRHCILNTYKPF